MRKKLAVLFLGAALTVSMLGACGESKDAADTSSVSAVSAASESTSVSSSSTKDASGTTENTASASADSTAAEENTTAGDAELADGVYTADFKTDSSMFHVNDAKDGKGTLTVKDGKMTIHISLVSKNIVNLFVGTAEDAQKDGAEILEPTTDTIDYGDGSEPEEVYGFDVPVPALDQEFQLALIGTKGVWYDHMVSVSNPVAEQ